MISPADETTESNVETTPPDSRKTIVVIGNGMVGLRFCEKLVEFDTARQYRIVTFCEEPRAAYDRVGLTSFFAHRDAQKLMLARMEWYREHGVELHLGDRASEIDREDKVVRSTKGVEIAYDSVVIATGSFPFVPPVPGVDKQGVFVYRTIEDLEHIIEYSKKSKRCAVIGGGLLGLEAAKAAYDLGLETHVIEFAPRLMPRQIDDAGSRILVQKIEQLGVSVHLNKGTSEISGNGHVEQMTFNDDSTLDVDMIIVSAGIRPRDDVARDCDLLVGERGGIQVNDHLQTSDPDIYAIGECALHGGMVYGLVAPGYDMAETVAANLTGGDRRFSGTDLSTKLKLMGVDVASFGDYESGPDKATPLSFEEPFSGVYKKLLFSLNGKRLLGGILVGDAADYGSLLIMSKTDKDLPCAPHELIVGSSSGAALGNVDGMPEDAQICSCNNVSKGDICNAICDQELDSVGAVRMCTKAGTGCGGCLPLVTDLFNAEMKRSGKEVVNHLCEHFPYSRSELFAIVKVKNLETFAQVMTECGQGNGCEVCKPAVTSILASLWNENILEGSHQTLQDTNDRFLANVQRGGSYSVVPRVPGGEITPDKLLAIGETAKKFKLYTKITGGQRIDMFGANVQDLPDIWERLIDAGFESGHAYGKALRTVKSCVGSTWCRYGVQDSVGFAIRVENRYKGIRAPHKIKMAVSGCVRECAEAQCKDVGLVATENGYNLYVCGNGGATPRHADLLTVDIDEEMAIRYIDRLLMYYISTADKLTRTSVWLGKLEGGIDHLRDVVIHDSLGLCDELESQMQHLIDNYQCEWTRVVNDPAQRARFRQFVNTEEEEPTIEFVSQRDQSRPADWNDELTSLELFGELKVREEKLLSNGGGELMQQTRWVQVGTVDNFPYDGGATIKYGKSQIAVFNFASRGKWYASQNMCPHKKAFVLSRGIVGDQSGTPKVACPLHKKTFSLETGESLQGEDYDIRTFPVKVEDGNVFLDLPPTEILDELLATEIGCSLATSCQSKREPVPV
ncbi:MAG: nitrite reductase large subunit NirB [Planctomycetota bacterium]|nr:nitrite reductase large subunit NirB [Planctomycetota bacterium]